MVLLDNVSLSLCLGTLESPMINGIQDWLQNRRQISGNNGTQEGQ